MDTGSGLIGDGSRLLHALANRIADFAVLLGPALRPLKSGRKRPRTYRAGMPQEKAAEILREGAGTQ